MWTGFGWRVSSGAGAPVALGGGALARAWSNGAPGVSWRLYLHWCDIDWFDDLAELKDLFGVVEEVLRSGRLAPDHRGKHGGRGRRRRAGGALDRVVEPLVERL